MARAMLVVVVALLLLGAACRDGGEGGVIALSWTGDYTKPSRAVVWDDGVGRPVGPTALEYLALRFAPDGASFASVVATGTSAGRMLVVVNIGGRHIVLDDAVDQPLDLVFSQQAEHLVVVFEDGIDLFVRTGAGVEEAWQRTAERPLPLRPLAPLDGDPWAPDGSQVAVGVEGGLQVLSVDGEPFVLAFAGAPFAADASTFAGWSKDGQLLVRDFASGIFYAHPPIADGNWTATVETDPQAAFAAAVERAITALQSELPEVTVAAVRKSADRTSVVVSGYAAAGEDGLTRGPFRFLVAIAPLQPGVEATVFDLGDRATLGEVNDGLLADAIRRP